MEQANEVCLIKSSLMDEIQQMYQAQYWQAMPKIKNMRCM